jgi:hypothetical protein
MVSELINLSLFEIFLSLVFKCTGAQRNLKLGFHCNAVCNRCIVNLPKCKVWYIKRNSPELIILWVNNSPVSTANIVWYQMKLRDHHV